MGESRLTTHYMHKSQCIDYLLADSMQINQVNTHSTRSSTFWLVCLTWLIPILGKLYLKVIICIEKILIYMSIHNKLCVKQT